LIGPKRFAAMRTRHSQKKRWLANSYKPDSVMNDSKLKSEHLSGLVGNLSQLMFGHFSMRFIFNSIDLASILNAPDDPREIDDRAGSEGIILRRPKWCVSQQNFVNDICHQLKVLVRVVSSPKSEKKILK